MKKDYIDFSRGDEDIVFIKTDADTSSIGEEENPRKALIQEMEDRGLELENAPIIGMFQGEFTVHLQEDSKIFIDGEQVYPQ